ncbi:MAG: hypothetical protein OEN56_06210, partial [Gemmatimonadota bacterium]|nr:hypothetical protein [Gemmatimonadota bacterium]
MPSARDDLTELTEALEGLLAGRARASIVDGICARGDFSDWLRRIRSAMSEHAFAVGERRIDLHHPVRRMDVRTRKDGFRVLHAWNHTSHRFTEDIVPVRGV